MFFELRTNDPVSAKNENPLMFLHRTVVWVNAKKETCLAGVTWQGERKGVRDGDWGGVRDGGWVVRRSLLNARDHLGGKAVRPFRNPTHQLPTFLAPYFSLP